MHVLALIVLLFIGFVGSEPAPNTAPKPARDPVIAAVERLDFLLGEWDGDGMLAGNEKSVTQKGPWKIEKAFGGRFVRLEFDAVVDEGAGGNNRFVGYFTFDPQSGKYTTLWLNVENLFQFRETGDLDADGRVLTLISEQSRKDGSIVKVRSVFTRADENHLTVEDHPLDEDGRPIRKSFGFELTRKKERDATK
ncbi:MAG: DUF1579 family protein [Phycisphaeraceae bacterium]|nr:DUF1579 family protein [Phycisphaeraceae bacterium]